MAIPAAALNAYAQAARMGGNTSTIASGGAKEAAGGGFGDFLEKAIDQTVDASKSSERQMALSTAGNGSNLIDVVTAVSEAETTLQTVMAVRDKVIAAYNDIIKMPI